MGHLVGRPSAHLNWLLTHQPQDMLGTGLPAPCWLLDDACILFLCPSVWILILPLIPYLNPISELWMIAAENDFCCLPHLADLTVDPGDGQLLTRDRCGFPEGCARLMRLCIPGTLLIRLVTTKYCHDSSLMTLTVLNLLKDCSDLMPFFFFFISCPILIMVLSCYWLVKNISLGSFLLFGAQRLGNWILYL